MALLLTRRPKTAKPRPLKILFQMVAQTASDLVSSDWYGTPFHLWGLGGPKVQGVAAAPRDLRPPRNGMAEALLEGRFVLAGETLAVGPGGDPWDKPCPSRSFAVELHRFSWLNALMEERPVGLDYGLQLCLDWRRAYGLWNSFSWGGDVLDRRVFNLACHLRHLAGVASELETLALCNSVARQARHLLCLPQSVPRAAERAAAAAIAGTALSGPVGERLMVKGLSILTGLLPKRVLTDGGHITRSPEATLELLYDLLTLDDALSQRGLAAPVEISRAIDRLTAAVRFFTLPDGRLACFQGGEESHPDYVAAARAHEDRDPKAREPQQALHSGYQRMSGRTLTVMMDVGAPARDVMSQTATAQPLAIEVLAGRERLITNSGWSPRLPQGQAWRLSDGGSTACLGDGSAGWPLRGAAANRLGVRLDGAALTVDCSRSETEAGVWLEAVHDGWAHSYGLLHERRLFLDTRLDEMRGEDVFPLAPGGPASRQVEVGVYFHLHPQVRATLARDRRSVLLMGPSNSGWWLRNDAASVTIEPSFHFLDGRPRRCMKVILHSPLTRQGRTRIRWKLAAAEPST